MTREELAAIRARVAAAADGPWEAVGTSNARRVWSVPEGRHARPLDGMGLFTDDDAAFIAHARVDVPALLAEVDRLEALLNPRPDGASEKPIDTAAMLREQQARRL